MGLKEQLMFHDNVESAIHESLERAKPLLVYCAKNGEETLTEVIDSLSPYKQHFVGVEVKEGTRDYDYFKQIIPQVCVSSIWVLKDGKILMSSKDLTIETINSNLEALFENHQIEVSNEQDEVNEHSDKAKQLENDEDFENSDKQLFDGLNRECLTSVNTDTCQSVLKSGAGHQDSESCLISFRLLDGSTMKHQFKSNDTLNDLRQWIDTQSGVEIISSDSMPSFARPDALQPTRYAFQSPEIPRITFDDSQEFLTLKELHLVPRCVLTLKPVYDESAIAYNNPNKGITQKLASSFGRFSNAVYSFFNYFNDEDDVNFLNDIEDDQHKTPTVISIGSRKIQRPTLINFEPGEDNIENKVDDEHQSEDLAIKKEISTESRQVLSHPSTTRIETLLSNDNSEITMD